MAPRQVRSSVVLRPGPAAPPPADAAPAPKRAGRKAAAAAAPPEPPAPPLADDGPGVEPTRTKAPGRVFDVTAGVVGALLLLGCVGLVIALPVPDEVPNQFRVTFAEQVHDLPGQTQYLDDLTDAASHKEFLFNVTHDNVFAVRIQLNFTDDVVASQPDRFKVEVFDAQGEYVGVLSLPNLPAKPHETEPGRYVPVEATASRTFSTDRPKPADLIAVGGPATTEADVVAKVAADTAVATKGLWKVRVNLAATGDCSVPSQSSTPEEVQRAVACREEVGPQQTESTRHDVGNSFTVGVFSYSRFEVTAEKLG